MGQILHGSATTTHAIRPAIQRSQASVAALSRTYGINPKTVLKWRKRATVEGRKTGPQEVRREPDSLKRTLSYRRGRGSIFARGLWAARHRPPGQGMGRPRRSPFLSGPRPEPLDQRAMLAPLVRRSPSGRRQATANFTSPRRSLNLDVYPRTGLIRAFFEVPLRMNTLSVHPSTPVVWDPNSI